MSKRKRQKPNPLQQLVRGFIRDAIYQINGTIPEATLSSPVEGTEAWYRDRLAAKLQGKTEVQTEAGRIDILTDREVIEVKRVSGWKAAIGQVKSYGRFYPNHKLRIHLFGKLTASKLQTIKATCQSEGIIVTWE